MCLCVLLGDDPDRLRRAGPVGAEPREDRHRLAVLEQPLVVGLVEHGCVDLSRRKRSGPRARLADRARFHS